MVSVGAILPAFVTLVHNGVVITNFANAANGGMPLMGVVEFGVAGKGDGGAAPPARSSIVFAPKNRPRSLWAAILRAIHNFFPQSPARVTIKIAPTSPELIRALIIPHLG